MFVTKANTASINTDFIYSIFSRVNNFKIYFHETNPGYQQGAMLAMEVAFDMHWFDGYDWVVRLNPDVLMRDDRVISREMRNASTVGVFVDCHEVRCDSPECTRKKVVNTDFFAFRPDSVDGDAFKYANYSQAEAQATRAFRSAIQSRNVSWLTGVGPLNGACRVRGDFSPVIHEHDINLVYPACLNWYRWPV